mmetsp:Transcript_31941/g.81263  ORF Transcript_31941/g.81263 Transcript_31941/m.81263 type:complete len:248 (+) Transcript_31941:3853-4596(+)
MARLPPSPKKPHAAFLMNLQSGWKSGSKDWRQWCSCQRQTQFAISSNFQSSKSSECRGSMPRSHQRPRQSRSPQPHWVPADLTRILDSAQCLLAAPGPRRAQSQAVQGPRGMQAFQSLGRSMGGQRRPLQVRPTFSQVSNMKKRSVQSAPAHQPHACRCATRGTPDASQASAPSQRRSAQAGARSSGSPRTGSAPARHPQAARTRSQTACLPRLLSRPHPSASCSSPEQFRAGRPAPPSSGTPPGPP